MVHGGRQMTGFVWVDPDAIEDDEALEDWVRTAERWVAALPIATKAPRKGARTGKGASDAI
jgi:hypothetical protein